MPLFLFRCACGKEKEVLDKEPPKTVECECGKHMEYEPFAGSTFVLKGKCWAKDGYG